MVLHGTVNPGNASTHYRFEWGIGSYEHALPVPDGEAGSGLTPKSVEQMIGNLAGSKTYQFRLVAENSVGQSTATGNFTTPDWSPKATTEGAEKIAPHTYRLHAKIKPEGFATSYGFEYGESEAYGAKVQGKTQLVGTAEQEVTLEVEGLAFEKTYHYRAFATNEGDGAPVTNHGVDKTVATSIRPIVTTEAPTYNNTFEPRLNASVNPEGTDTHYQFEYGESEAYGSTVPAQAEDIGSGNGPVSVSTQVKGLPHNKVIHFRVVATNEVGTRYGSDQSFTTLGVCKNGGEHCEWSSQTARNPIAPPVSLLEGVSCPAGGECWAVGRANEGWQGMLQRWTGSEWQLYTSASAEGGYLHGVSCPSASYCIAVGEDGEGHHPYASRMEETGVWRSLPPPAPSGSVSQLKLQDVSCTAAGACTAVGSYYNGTRTVTLAERLSGGEWSVQSTPNPEGSQPAELRGVSCSSSGECLAVGLSAGKAFSERWSNGAWTMPTTPAPSGSETSELEKVSCPTSGFCMAVGHQSEAGGPGKAFAERWSGGEWSLLAAPVPAGAQGTTRLSAVSCTSANFCEAVGRYVSAVVIGYVPKEERTLAETWSESGWTIQPTTNTAQKVSRLNGVSCSSSIACTAVGDAASGPSEPLVSATTLAERYE
jgi:hypothetical protein